LGLDISARSIQIAAATHSSPSHLFATFEHYTPVAGIDLAYCNGVFHHIPLEQRDTAVQYIHRCLRPGGIFAFWENNPRNPGTRYVMAKCEFDQDAVPISPPAARRLLAGGGFKILGTDYLFFFPGWAGPLRLLEPALRRFPLGAQYQVLCRKPFV